jgi:hypothetical protein
VAKPNYRHAKKQKELSRKLRQAEKQQRRSVRPGLPPAVNPADETTEKGKQSMTNESNFVTPDPKP